MGSQKDLLMFFSEINNRNEMELEKNVVQKNSYVTQHSRSEGNTGICQVNVPRVS